MPVFNHYAAGIDIGDTIQCVAVSNGNGGHEVKTTTGFTCDLEEIVNYLVEKKNHNSSHGKYGYLLACPLFNA